MPIVTDNYMLSLTQDNRVLRVRCSQNDTSRQVKFTLYNNGTPFTIPSGLSVSVRGIKQNGNIFTKSCSYSGSVVTLVLGTQITDIAGISVAELVFTDSSGGKIGTSNFIFQVESDPLLKGTVSITEETPTEYISDLISMVEALSARVNNIIAPAGEASLSEVVDARLSGYSGTTYQNLKARIDADFAALGNTKADKSDTYTKEEVDDAIDNVTITTDETLSVPGAAADAKKTGDAISEINGSLGDLETSVEVISNTIENLNTGLTDAQKAALLACFRNVSWKETDGISYYNTLESVLYNISIVSISASFDSGGTIIYVDTPLSTIKQYLLVTALAENGASFVVADYELSGNLIDGTSVLTVAYRGKTTTVNVQSYLEEKWIDGYNSNNTANITYNVAPFMYGTDQYQYNYSKRISAIESNFAVAGKLTIGKYTAQLYDGKPFDIESNWSEIMTINIQNTGFQKIRVTPITLASGEILTFGKSAYLNGDNTAFWKYGSNGEDKGFYAAQYANNKIIKSGTSLGLNIYTIRS